MKTIKINYVGFWSGFNPYQNNITQLLKKHYNVIISNNPDYIFCSIHKKKYEYVSYDCIRILIEGEPYTPDFNLIDYAIGTYPISFYDRYFSLPCGIESFIRGNNHFRQLSLIKRDNNEISNKKYFASFIASHESEFSIRGDFYKELCKYKPVSSVGSYLNNQNGMCVNFIDNSKINFMKKCKFSLCFESTKQYGFVSEKIEDAFIAGSIPVYYGSSTVFDIYNKDAFIYCKGKNDFSNVISKIKELDNNDEKYCKMLREPVFNKDNYSVELMKKFENYLCYIFDQDLKDAKRRIKYASPLQFNNYLLETYQKNYNSNIMANNKLILLIKKLYIKIKYQLKTGIHNKCNRTS